jgi:peptidoglycan hydrolase-like protein with peptidoglycan-binding domain
MALYPKAVKKLIPPGKTDPRITARVLIYHIAVTESDSLYEFFRERSGGVESHFYIRRDGTVEQYRDTDYEADANWHANRFAISIETQGMANGEWTKEQVAALKELTLWVNANHPVPLTEVTKWDGAGVGYHSLFSPEWTGGARSCPGPDRIKQFGEVIVPWLATQATAPHTDNPRPPASAVPPLPKPKPKPAGPKKRQPKPVGLVKRGDGGTLVAVYQGVLGVHADGLFGPITDRAVRKAQAAAGLAVDGIIGPNTARALLGKYGTLGLADRNPSVRLLQWIGGITTDAIFGQVTKTAVVEMQAWAGIDRDGLVGPQTRSKIVR